MVIHFECMLKSCETTPAVPFTQSSGWLLSLGEGSGEGSGMHRCESRGADEIGDPAGRRAHAAASPRLRNPSGTTAARAEGYTNDADDRVLSLVRGASLQPRA
jgi:hypothetical protein